VKYLQRKLISQGGDLVDWSNTWFLWRRRT